MSWTKLKFGKYKGRTLPQVLFTDPDWFFYMVGEGAFGGALGDEAQELADKARRIKIPRNGGPQLMADYFIHPQSMKFDNIQLVPPNHPRHDGASPTRRSAWFDLSMARAISDYDKTGGTILIREVKKHLFGDSSHKMTRQRAEAFFEDDSNFDL